MNSSTLINYLKRQAARYPDLGMLTMLGVAKKLGNGKRVRTWNLPPESTCCAGLNGYPPTASGVCKACCYAWKMREGRPAVAERARKNWTVAQRADFATLLSAAILHHGVSHVRLHDFGEFFSESYIRDIIAVVRACRDVRFWAYTRAWRRPDWTDALTDLAAEPRVSLLLSADRVTGMPPAIANTRVAWLADTDADGPPRQVHVVFRATRDRTANGRIPPLMKLGNSLVCPHENGVYAPAVTSPTGGSAAPTKLGPADCLACGHCLFAQRGAANTNQAAAGGAQNAHPGANRQAG